jgi:hypothetical protein
MTDIENTPLSPETILWAYRLFLDREPESAEVVEDALKRFSSTSDVRQAFFGSEEFQQKSGHLTAAQQSPFFHYAAAFDPIGLMKHHAARELRPKPGYLTNFLGVLIDPKFFPAILDGMAGRVEALPIPANWHADVAEWGTALRAVDLSSRKFTMIELGCGWGCWMNNTGVAARAAGRQVHLIGVEGDRGHLQFAAESLQCNGFHLSEFTLYRGIAAASSGTALFPKQASPGVEWGGMPVFRATPEEQAKAMASGAYEELPMVALSDIVARHPKIDLLHVDIQGGEADLVDETLPLLGKNVAYMVIGTHSKQIEGRLYESLLRARWIVEMDRPAVINVTGLLPYVAVDGVQGWRNPKLLPLAPHPTPAGA